MACWRVPAMISRKAQPTAIAIQSAELVNDRSVPATLIGTIGVISNCSSGLATGLPLYRSLHGDAHAPFCIRRRCR